MGITITGLEPLEATLKDYVTLDDVKRIVLKRGADLTDEMKAQTTKAYVKGYSTGDTAGSINLQIDQGGMRATVKPTTNYVPYVEYGTRFMSPEPIAQPALDIVAPMFLSDLKRICK